MKSSAEFTCDCDVTTTFDFVQPAQLKPIFHPVTCRGCGSVWTVRFRKDFLGRTTFAFKIETPSRRLLEHLAKKKQHKDAHAPQKKAPQFFLKN